MRDESRLDELLSLWERRRGAGAPASPEELCRERPELLPALRALVVALESLAPRLDVTGSTATADSSGTLHPEALPGSLTATTTYRVESRHARGGLGEVFLARDEQLGREVALKFIRPSLDHDLGRRQRFVREAEITGRLEHPGIVPVYAAGTDEGGQPFYAMRLIRGQTLRDAIEQFHAADAVGRDPVERALAFRQLLSRLVGVCNAIAYAHETGIVHRDLKPANIMLGPYGETLVVDWGLAKAVGVAEEPDSLAHLLGASATEPSETATGAVFGTPVFMSPAQANGQAKQAGPADDIYSLGATLYTLLVGRPPFAPASAGELLDRVRRGEFPRPRAVKPVVPAALEAVCLKAMANQPKERYGSALDLVADLEHWLADEPVSAHREPTAVRLRRWARRHRTYVTSAGLAGVVAVTTLSLAVVLLERANARERQTADEARKQSALAEESFAQARAAVDTYFVRVSQSKLGSVPGTQPLRRELLQIALVYYQDFLRRRGDDPALTGEAAEAYHKVGRVLRELASFTEAISAYENGLALRRRLATEAPSDDERALALAEQLKDYGTDLRHVGRHTDGLKALDEAARILEDIRHRAPENDKAEEYLSKVHVNRGLLLGEMAKSEDAVAASRLGLEALERRGRRRPDERQIRYDTAVAYINLGNDVADLGRDDEAIQLFRRAGELAEEIVRQDREQKNTELLRTTEGRDLLALTNYNLGWRYQVARRYEESIKSLTRARDGWGGLLSENPAVTKYRHLLIFATENVAFALYKQKRLEEALQQYEAARPLAERLREEELDSPRSLNDVAISWDGAAMVFAAQGRREDAQKAFDRAHSLHQQCRAKSSQTNAVSYSQHFEQLGKAWREWGDLKGAESAAHERRRVAGTLPLELFGAAVDFGLCSAIADGAQKESLAGEAIATLQQAAAAGFKDLARIEVELAFTPLRDRPDFRAVIAEIEAERARR
jgi:eukaryotic-like serine/threonine-protein kinase